MMQWKLLSGLLTFLATIQAHPISEDYTDIMDELVVLDENFPGYGGYRQEGLSPTSATLGDSTHYSPGHLHASYNRRLELTKSADMKKLETYFGEELEIDITKLPTKSESNPIPWPSSYWPTYADSINYRWAKHQPSPAEKYATAFGHDVKTLMDDISAKNGIDSQTKRLNCTQDEECKHLNDGSICSKREGMETGRCIPKWFGICHAWAPAAILEAEPTCAVERNGVIFQPYDIKALLTLAYDGSKIPTVFTGTRFNGNDNGTNITDEYGRYYDTRRRDISSSFFHIALTNIMGRWNHSFIVDITAGNEVWNQPARSYEILRMSWMTPNAAAEKFFNVSTYPFNDAATRIAVVTTRFSWIVESGQDGPLVATGRVNNSTASADYEYILETDDSYRILGGEWIRRSRYNHVDFLWIPGTKPDNSTVTKVGLVYAEVEGLLDESVTTDCTSSYTPQVASTPPTLTPVP